MIELVNDILSVVTCFQAKTGKMMWQQRCGQPVKHGFSSSPPGPSSNSSTSTA